MEDQGSGTGTGVDMVKSFCGPEDRRENKEPRPYGRGSCAERSGLRYEIAEPIAGFSFTEPE